MASGNVSTSGSGTPGFGRGWLARLSEADQAELLALVEGRLNAEQERTALRRWKEQPEVVAFVESAIKDRVAVRSMPETAAPASLLNRVEAALEREALLGESGEETPVTFSTGVEQGTLVSSRPPRAPSFSGRRLGSHGLRYAALAATLLLATVVTIQMVRSTGTNSPASTITQRDAGESREVADRPTTLSSEAAQREPAAPVPMALSVPESPGDLASGTGDSANAVAMAEPSDPQELSVDQALALAREGRLMVRVVTGSVDRAVERVRTGEDRRLADAVASVDVHPSDADRIAEVAESVRPLEFRTSPLDGPEDGGPLVASDKAAPTVNIRSRAVTLDLPQSRRAVTRVDIQVTPQALDSLKIALETRGRFVQFVELPEALPVEPVFQPEQALWWTQPPSAWSPTVDIPVVFEQP